MATSRRKIPKCLGSLEDRGKPGLAFLPRGLSARIPVTKPVTSQHHLRDLTAGA